MFIEATWLWILCTPVDSLSITCLLVHSACTQGFWWTGLLSLYGLVYHALCSGSLFLITQKHKKERTFTGFHFIKSNMFNLSLLPSGSNTWFLLNLHLSIKRRNLFPTFVLLTILDVLFSGLAFHPIDGILQAVPHVIALFVVPMHFTTHIALLFIEAIWTANIHDCIHAKIWPVMGAGYHTIHHTTYRHNYGHYTIWMDWMFGTLRDPIDDELKVLWWTHCVGYLYAALIFHWFSMLVGFLFMYVVFACT